MIELAAALVMMYTTAEAFGLPGPIARRLGIGLRSREWEFDRELNHLIEGFHDLTRAYPGREDQERASRWAHRVLQRGPELVMRIRSLRAPNREWQDVASGYGDVFDLVLDGVRRGDEASRSADIEQRLDDLDRRRAERAVPTVGRPGGSPGGANGRRRSDWFAYDQPNQLRSATVAGSSETYAYDGDGVRVSRQVGANPATRYVSDVATGLPVTLDDETRKYVWGEGLAYAVSGTTLEVYHTDRLGSVRAITDGLGAVSATYRTDEFGIPTASAGGSTQPFAYTGEPRDATGLSYLRARYYDPSLGRFLSRDPWPGAVNAPLTLDRYAYVENNPATYNDPSGKCIKFIFASLVGGPAVLVGIAASGTCLALAAAAAAASGAAVYIVANGDDIDIPGISAPPPPTGTLTEPVPPPPPLRPPQGFRCPPGVLCRMVVVFGAGGLVTFYYVYQIRSNAGNPRPQPGPPPEPLPPPKSRVLTK